MKTVSLYHSIFRLFVTVLTISLAFFTMFLLEAQPAYANTVTIHDDAGIYYEPPSLLNPNAQGQISDPSDSGEEKQIKARASTLPYDIEIYTHFGAGNNEQALYEQAESDGYGKKEIVLEIDTDNQAIAIYGDKSIPLDDQDYQLVHDAFHQTLSQALTSASEKEKLLPLLTQDAYYRATISAVSALSLLFIEKSESAQNASYESIMRIISNIVVIIVILCVTFSPILFKVLSAQHRKKVRSAEFASSNRTSRTRKTYGLPDSPLFIDPLFDESNDDSGDRGGTRYPR